MESSKVKGQRLGFRLLITFLAFAIASCDKVDGPYKEPKIVVPPDTTNINPSPTDTSVIFDTYRKVLVEDYTGHQCGNCPEAAKKLEEIITVYGKKVVPLAIHAGFFSETAPVKYTRNFKTPIGNAIDAYFGISNAGNPNGMINRKGWLTTSHIINLNAWEGKVSNYSNESPDALIGIKNSYDNTTKNIVTKVYTKFKNSLVGNFKLCVFLTEDSIIGPQKDYSLTPDYNNNYIFEHVLRASFVADNPWGEDIAVNPTASETQIFRKTYSMNLAGKLFDLSHPCTVVAFVYNDVSKEVIQASMQKIK